MIEALRDLQRRRIGPSVSNCRCPVSITHQIIRINPPSLPGFDRDIPCNYGFAAMTDHIKFVYAI